MTADIRTAAQREAEHRWPSGEQWSPKEVESARGRFMMGAVWAADRVTPTLAQIETVIIGRTSTAGAHAVMALMQVVDHDD